MPHPVLDAQSRPPLPKWGVDIDESAIERLAGRWANRDFLMPGWNYFGLPPWTGPAWLDFCVLAVSVVGCLWPPDGRDRWEVLHEAHWLSDAPGLFACFTRSLQPTRTGLDLGRFTELNRESSERFFEGRGFLQLITSRRSRLSQLARVIEEDWGGHAVNLVETAGRNAEEVVNLLSRSLPGYRDEWPTEPGLLRFNKLAHLATAMMAARSPVPIHGVEQFPVYPDYILPMVLRHHRILVYEPALAEAVDERRLLDPGSQWELAIRWATVYAAAELRQRLNQRGNDVVTPALDFALWHSGVMGSEASTMGEHHRVLSLAY